MKCWINRKQNLGIMLVAGLALLLVGVGGALLIGEEASALTMRLLGFMSGLGGALASCCIAWLIWKKIVGEKRAQDKELEMQDERGQTINAKASAAMSVAATLSVIAMVIVATVRGDGLYMAIGCAGCFAIAATGAIARAVLGRRL